MALLSHLLDSGRPPHHHVSLNPCLPVKAGTLGQSSMLLQRTGDFGWIGKTVIEVRVFWQLARKML